MAGEKTLATNKKARHEYFIEDTYECGIELKGTEVKSIILFCPLFFKIKL